MADQVMKIDGNFKPYVNAAKTAEQATKKVAKEAGEIGSQMEKGVGKALIKVELLKMALTKVVDALSRARDTSIAASTSGGDRALRVRDSANKLGLSDPRGLERIIGNRQGGGTLDATMSFMENLAEQNRSSNVPMSGKDAEALIDTFNQGGEPLYGKGGADILEGLRSGRSGGSIVEQLRSERLGNNNQRAYAEVRVRSAIDRKQLAEEFAAYGNGTAPVGDTTRIYDAQNAQRQATGEQGIAGSITYGLTPDMIQQNIDTAAGWTPDNNEMGDTTMEGILKAINAQTGIIQRANAPTPNLNAEVK